MKTILITGADRGVGLGMTTVFLEAGWRVFAGQYMPQWKELEELHHKYPDTLHIVELDVSKDDSVKRCYDVISSKVKYLDMLVSNAGIVGNVGDIFDLKDFDKGLNAFNVNTLGPFRMVQAFLPLIDKEESMKRLCFVSSEAGSISVSHRRDGFTYPMSKTALNMGVKLLFKELRPRGFTFRLYHPGWVRSYMSGKKNTEGKYEPIETARSAFIQFTNDSPREDVLFVHDNENITWPF
ncbi:MAG: SDR family NAD(P)-dependent oxidoreductase [Caldicoprobacterales bacterium]|jgi:NAD(P)-dependent dehydrogenase (short-subunit alcohol dehydrogenase family)|nr:SDR family NAD(P)-dependent oxidoreductase [Clostridiales bacterium]